MAAARSNSSKKSQPTPPRPRKTTAPAVRGAAPVPEPKPQPVQLEDGTTVVFSFSHWLAERGLDGTKPVEVGGRIFQFRATGTTEENTKLFQHMATGDYRSALELMLVDAEEVDDVIGLLRVPFATRDESRMWREFTEAVSGVTLGESSAS